MITLEKLAKELKIKNIDKIIGGRMTWTTLGGTSGVGGMTFTTDTSTKRLEGGHKN